MNVCVEGNRVGSATPTGRRVLALPILSGNVAVGGEVAATNLVSIGALIQLAPPASAPLAAPAALKMFEERADRKRKNAGPGRIGYPSEVAPLYANKPAGPILTRGLNRTPG